MCACQGTECCPCLEFALSVRSSEECAVAQSGPHVDVCLSKHGMLPISGICCCGSQFWRMRRSSEPHPCGCVHVEARSAALLRVRCFDSGFLRARCNSELPTVNVCMSKHGMLPVFGICCFGCDLWRECCSLERHPCGCVHVAARNAAHFSNFLFWL